MSEDFWVEVEEAYNQAAELPPNARTTFLDQAYSDRSDIRREVESLLGITRLGAAVPTVYGANDCVGNVW